MITSLCDLLKKGAVNLPVVGLDTSQLHWRVRALRLRNRFVLAHGTMGEGTTMAEIRDFFSAGVYPPGDSRGATLGDRLKLKLHTYSPQEANGYVRIDESDDLYHGKHQVVFRRKSEDSPVTFDAEIGRDFTILQDVLQIVPEREKSVETLYTINADRYVL